MNKYDEAVEFACAEVGCAYIEEYKPRLDFYKLAIEALKQAKERENPQALTLEQLKERVGKPVYHDTGRSWRIIEYVDVEENTIAFTDGEELEIDDVYDVFYGHEPKGE